MINGGKKNVLGVAVDAIDYEAAVDRIVASAISRERCTTAALAVHGVMTGVQDPKHRYRLNHLDLVVPDGQPVRWALNLLHGARLPDRVYGPTLALELCKIAEDKGLPVYFYGSRPDVVERLAANLARRFPGLVIAGATPSKFRRLTPEEREETVREIRSSGAVITFVGLGCPRQEVWAFEFGDRLSMPTIAVGAAFDFHAGNLRQAPAILQRYGLEWAFRLAMEPRRLWRRYLLLNPLYIMYVGLQWIGAYRPALDDVAMPDREELYG